MNAHPGSIVCPSAVAQEEVRASALNPLADDGIVVERRDAGRILAGDRATGVAVWKRALALLGDRARVAP